MRAPQSPPARPPEPEPLRLIRTQHAHQSRPAPSPQPPEQLAHRAHPGPLTTHQPQITLLEPQLFLGLIPAFSSLSPPSQNPGSFE